MKKYLLIFGFTAGILFVMAQVARAETCTAPPWKTDYDCRTKDCAGKQSYPTYQFEACLTKCDNDISAANAAYDACLARQRQAQQEQQQQEAAQQQQESQSIYQPIEQLQQDLQTPGPAIPPPAELAPPAPLVAQDTPNTQYLQMPKKGDIINAPAGQKTDIPLPDGQINLEEGSTLQYIGKNIWQAISGAFHFVLQHLPKREVKVKTPNAVCAVRGTQFTINVATDGTTKVQALKDVVSVSNAEGKKTVNVKAGWETTVDQNGPAKPTPITTAETWYQNIPPSPDFFDSSWTKTGKADKYSKNCAITADPALPTRTLTAEEQTVLDTLNQALTVFRVKTVDSASIKEKKLSAAKEKTTLADGTKSEQFFVSSKGIYYPAGQKGAWKMFTDKTMINNILKLPRDENIPFAVDKASLQFEKWEGEAGARVAVYSGTFSTAGNNDLIKTAFAMDAAAGQELALVRVSIDEESRLWTGFGAIVNVKSGEISVPMTEICHFTYDTAVKVNLPTKVKKVNAKTGLAELQKIISEVR